MGGKLTQRSGAKKLKSPLHAMQAYNPTIRQYRNCQHSNPTAGRPFGTNLSVKDKAQVAVQSRPIASLVLAVVIIGLILLLPQRAGRQPGQREAHA
jgi:hypothetical protein